MRMQQTRSLWRFVVVGVAVTLLHALLATGLIVFRHWSPTLAHALAFGVANQFSYLGNTCWSFEQRPDWKNWQRFIGVSFFSWLLTLLIVSLVARLGGHHLLGTTLVLTVVPAMNYLGHRAYTYVENRDMKAPAE